MAHALADQPPGVLDGFTHAEGVMYIPHRGDARAVDGLERACDFGAATESVVRFEQDGHVVFFCEGGSGGEVLRYPINGLIDRRAFLDIAAIGADHGLAHVCG